MTRFSANLGFLWTDRALPDAIRAAKAAGFDAVECHWPYEVAPGAVKAALAETQLQMLGLNTRRGDVAAGDNGLAAIPGRRAEAQAMIEQAIDYAVQIGAGNIHVMAGYAKGTEALLTFIDTLIWACNKAARHGLTILIEPLNAYDAPGYFLQTTQQAAKIIEDVGAK
ncbi:TIM barrel protein, partial [Pseudophaeobacter leonis]|uniref:TIM barrel protein n=1 Tax=Pseudophaeobacter leonis TaxID=1144477 RepID=UPI00111C4A99